MFRCYLVLLALHLVAVSAQAAGPNLTLPWGTWQATKYDEAGDFWTFENVRFGKAPIGSLRFNKSVFPDPIKNPQHAFQDSSYGPSCFQVDATKKCTPGGDLSATPPGCSPVANTTFGEDCLFLDLYVPNSVYTSGVTDLPVLVWIYGGAYVFGSKNEYHSVNVPLYNGTGILRTANSEGLSAIYVAGNYRLGALGWLAGSYMEQLASKNIAVPNAGFYDQMLLLEWIQKYIYMVGGDKTHVTAMGESAGAGSILHHLLARGGQQDPTFKQAILQSPAFEWQWDREGTLNQVYQNFSYYAGCGKNFNITCLQNVGTDEIAAANQQFFEHGTKCTGLYPLGPSLDGILFNELPPIAFGNGNYWQGINTLIVSHVGNETASFIPPYIRPDYPADFTYFLNSFLPEKSLGEVRAAIEKQYPLSQYPNQQIRAMIVIRDSTFTCNTRQLWDGYNNIAKTYMMQYNFEASNNLDVHASDLLPLFWNSEVNMTFYLETCKNLPWYEANPIAMAITKLAGGYQEFFARAAITGDPNDPGNWDPLLLPWVPAYANERGELTDVMEVAADDFSSGVFFSRGSTDVINTAETCGFWTQVAQNITAISQWMGKEALNVHGWDTQAVLNEL